MNPDTPMGPDPSFDASLLAALLQEITLGWILLDRHERVVIWNPWMERTVGLPVAEVLGHTLGELFPDVSGSRLERAIGEALRRGLPSVLTPRLNPFPLPLAINGQPVHQLIQVKPLEPAGQGRHCFIQIHNVTQTATRDRRLRQRVGDLRRAGVAASRAQTLLLAHIGHELRTPLSAMLGMAELMLTADDLHKVRRQARVIHDSGHALRAILDDLLDYSRIETKALTVASVGFDANALFSEIRDQVASRARSSGIDFYCQLPLPLPDPLLGDPQRLRQLLTQLFERSFRSTPRGELHWTLRVLSSDPSGIWLGMVIRDTGQGMDREIRQGFLPSDNRDDLFFASSPEVGELGPAIARELILRMGGRLAIATNPGQGTEITLELPLARPPATLPEGPSERPFSRDVRLLIVEDDEVNREVTRSMLKRLGITPDLANDGEAALQLVTRQRYDLIFMDCQMPTMDGYTASRQIRSREEAAGQGERVPIVALTAYALKGDRERCLEAGMDDYLAKPVRGEALRQAILRWVRWQAG
ncbi:MAG: response regulator [Magnetococcales bacterium]|nr:response regulator [Magnetococcales bacterium]